MAILLAALAPSANAATPTAATGKARAAATNAAAPTPPTRPASWTIFGPPVTGTVAVDATPDTGEWVLNGPAGFSDNGVVQTGDLTFPSSPVGHYRLACRDNVAGLDPPATQTLTLTAGATLSFTPVWTSEPPGSGTVAVDATPDTGEWVLNGPPGFADNGAVHTGDLTFPISPVGQYQLVCHDNVAGLDPPATQTLPLAAGATLSFTPVWTTEPPPVGTVAVDATPNTGEWVLNGPTGFADNGTVHTGDLTFPSSPVGQYQLVCHDNVAGLDPPATQTLPLTAGGTLSFTPVWTIETPGGDEITVNLPGNVPMVLVRIPAGSFQMGSPDTERSRGSDEGPVHTVNIAQDFYMGKTAVTQAQWVALMGSNPSYFQPPLYTEDLSRPVEQVSWNDIMTASTGFMAKLNAHLVATGQAATGAPMRLPSEAEREYACRAGTQTRFFFGDSLSVDDIATDGPAGTLPGNRSDYMWFWYNCYGDYGDANGAFGTKPVGTKLPNQFGLHDMSGNVWEWCQDWWHANYTGAPADGSAWEAGGGSSRVLRGGSWDNSAFNSRSATRGGSGPVYRDNAHGFRVARVVAGP